MAEKMKVATVKTKYCRTTGKKISSEIISVEEVNEKEFYNPLVKIFGDLYMKERELAGGVLGE